MSAKKQSGDEAVKSFFRGVDKLLREGKSPKQVKSSLLESGLDQETESTVVQNAVEMQGRARANGLGIGSWLVLGLFVFLLFAWIINMQNKMDEALERFGPVITALVKYRTVKGGYPDSLNKLTPTYLSEIPNCPWRRSYRRYDDGSQYTITCITSVIIFFPQGVRYNSHTKRWERGEL